MIINELLIKKLFSDKLAWSYISLDEYYQLQGEEQGLYDDTVVQQQITNESESNISRTALKKVVQR